MNDYISREAAIAEIMGQPPDAHYPSRYAEQIKKLTAAEVKTLEKIGDEVDEALRILDDIHGRMDYGDYCDLHDAIAGIAVPDFGADGKEGRITMVKVYGYSDDVVTIEGGSHLEEIGCFDRDVRICFRDGTVIRVGYSKPDMAVWYVIIEKVGTAAQTLTECMDEDADVYSDVFEIESEVLTHEVVRKEAAQ